MDIDGLQERIGYRFDEPGLLTQALTHRSHGQPNNERLEFLGDSVLNCAIATVLFERFPDVDEGDLSRSRAFLVKQQALHNVAQRLALGESLVLGAGESRSGGTRRPSILADALEALIGAVYLDSGFEAAKSLIGRLYEPELMDADPLTLGKDAKTLLQEELQQKRLSLPVYSVVATHGAAHNQEFEVECVIPRLDISVLGRGGSRRAAEQSAADAALSALSQVKSPKSTKKARKATKKRGAAKKPRPATMKSAASSKDGDAEKENATEKTGSTEKAASTSSRARGAPTTGKNCQSAARAEKSNAADRPGKENPVAKGGKVNGSDKPVKADTEATAKSDAGPSSAPDSSSSKTPDATESV